MLPDLSIPLDSASMRGVEQIDALLQIDVVGVVRMEFTREVGVQDAIDVTRLNSEVKLVSSEKCRQKSSLQTTSRILSQSIDIYFQEVRDDVRFNFFENNKVTPFLTEGALFFMTSYLHVEDILLFIDCRPSIPGHELVGDSHLRFATLLGVTLHANYDHVRRGHTAVMRETDSCPSVRFEECRLN